MTTFVLLYTGGGMPDNEEEAAAVMQAWEAWFGKLGAAVVDGGNPFAPVAKSIASDGSVSNGAVLGMATGYSILQADSLDEAVEMAKGCPNLTSGGQVSVYETFPAM